MRIPLTAAACAFGLLVAAPSFAGKSDPIQKAYQSVRVAVRNGAMYKFTRVIKKSDPERSVDEPPGGFKIQLLRTDSKGYRTYQAKAFQGSHITVTVKRQKDGVHVKRIGHPFISPEDFE